jgi:glycine/D-amino acid oxidase-like deaminating enzyme
MSHMGEPLVGKDPIAVIGAGVIGCSIAWALTGAGRDVLLIDRADPATAGASYGNVGHIATEQLQPLPSPQILLRFWRELLAFGGPLDIPLRRIAALSPWIARFAQAAFRQPANTKYLAPLVECAADVLESKLEEIGRRDLLRRNGHYALWFGANAPAALAAQLRSARELAIPTAPPPKELLNRAAAATREPRIAGLWFPKSAHVLDPAVLAQAFASASMQRGATMLRASVRHIQPNGNRIEIVNDTGSLSVRTAVVCAGAWSSPLLASFGLHAPLAAERGYHIEMPGQTALADAPILYADKSIVVTPMTSRLRASSYLEFAGLDAPPDPRKPARLRAALRELGYQCDLEGPSWMGPRPTLPDYLPGIGRASGQHELFYAVGHQHLGLTLAAVTADLMADLVCGRPPRFDVSGFDLRRFGPWSSIGKTACGRFSDITP